MTKEIPFVIMLMVQCKKKIKNNWVDVLFIQLLYLHLHYKPIKT
jgi:hypothetical protein